MKPETDAPSTKCVTEGTSEKACGERDEGQRWGARGRSVVIWFVHLGGARAEAAVREGLQGAPRQEAAGVRPPKAVHHRLDLRPDA